MAKEKLKKYYLRFFRTNQIRKILAKNDEDALRVAKETFGEAENNYEIGHLRHAGSPVKLNFDYPKFDLKALGF